MIDKFMRWVSDNPFKFVIGALVFVSLPELVKVAIAICKRL
jgi:hypothetical protein